MQENWGDSNSPVLFHEVQHYPFWTKSLLGCLPGCAGWYCGFILFSLLTMGLFGDRGSQEVILICISTWLCGGILMPWYFFAAKLETIVMDHGIILNKSPMGKGEEIPFAMIHTYEPRQQGCFAEFSKPISQSILWAADFSFGSPTGLVITLISGRRIYIGSQLPIELKLAVDRGYADWQERNRLKDEGHPAEPLS